MVRRQLFMEMLPMNETKKKRGFAAMSPDQLRQIASAGGVARREAYKLARQNRAAMAPQASNGHNGASASSSAA